MNLTPNLLELFLMKDKKNTIYIDSDIDFDIEKIKTLNLNSRNIMQISITNMHNIEYLSLQNNLIKQIHFLKYFPNLWYLDIRNNLVIILYSYI
jgi:hypothetical protein